MSKGNGYLQLRRGVFEHVRDGRMTMTEAFCYIYMLTQADTRTGIWNGSAGSLSGELAMPQRTARNILEALDRRYIKRFATPGRHSCYPIALHKFLVTDGEHKSEHLNALESKSPIDLRYFSRQQMGEQEGEHIGQHMAAQKRIENRNKKQTPSPLASQEGFEAFYKEYPRKEAPARARRAWLKVKPEDVPAVMAGLERYKRNEQWQREGGRFIPHPATFLNDQRWKDELAKATTQNGNGNSGHGHIPTAADCRPTR